MKNDNFSLSISRGNCSVVMERRGKDLTFGINAIGAVNECFSGIGKVVVGGKTPEPGIPEKTYHMTDNRSLCCEL